jgi:molybdopterin/thiamine biosynthesis adenylyltransferase
VDEQLRSVFQARTDSPFYGSVVVRLRDGELSFSGLLWRDDEVLGPITLLREFGQRFTFISSIDAPEPLPAPSVFNRQVIAFGGAVQALLRDLHIGVVGAGGTGSAVAEVLIRSGVGRVTVVDYQTLERTNVTRVYGSSLRQVGRRKVDVVVDNARRIGLRTRIDPIGRKLDLAALQSLQACDLIFSCTDDHAGRLDVARLAYWCLVPVIDMAVKLDAVTDPHQGIYCRVDVQLPGEPCVQCAEVVDPDAMRAEGLSDAERGELEREGYLPGQANRDPAVIVYTSLVANLAMSELLVRLTGIGPDDSPGRLMFYGHLRHLGLSQAPPDPLHWCARPSTWGAAWDERGFYLGRVWPK